MCICGGKTSVRESLEGCKGKGTTYLINPLALEMDIYSLAHHLCKM